VSAVLTYGGVSLFIVVLGFYPFAAEIERWAHKMGFFSSDQCGPFSCNVVTELT